MVKHIVSWSGGKDSSAMLIRMVEEDMPIDDIVFIEVMATPMLSGEFPEMHEYIHRMERYIGRRITVVQSPLDFDTVFHRVYQSGQRAGKIYGFPLTCGAWCNDRLKLRTIRQHYKTYGEHIRYLGLAADEPKRLARLEACCRSPLAEWSMTEQDCIDFLEKREMLNPLYRKFKRLGCWFCVKQSLPSLRVLHRDYPEYWSMLMAWDKESPRTFKPKTTVAELDQRFQFEEALAVQPIMEVQSCCEDIALRKTAA